MTPVWPVWTSRNTTLRNAWWALVTPDESHTSYLIWSHWYLSEIEVAQRPRSISYTGLRPVIDFRANFFKDLAARNYWTDLHLVCCSWQIIVSSFTENTREYQHLRNSGSKLTLNMSNSLKTWLQAPTRSWDNLRVLGESSWPCEYGKIPADTSKCQLRR